MAIIILYLFLKINKNVIQYTIKKKKEVKGNIEILNTKNNSRIIKLPSKEIKMYSLFNMSRTGVFEKKKIKLKKAGESRWLGNKSSVRGVAMNPVDHPHGGGEGKSKGRISSSKWGKLSKGGVKTKKIINKWILSH